MPDAANQPQMIFVNLPSTDIPRARAFYAGLGFDFDERFCNDADTLMIRVSETIHLMLLERAKFASFTSRPVAPEGTVGTLVCLSQPSAGAVDALVARAVAHGGADNDRTQAMGDFMYGRSVSDPDGNVIEVMWMDVQAAMRAWGQAAALSRPPGRRWPCERGGPRCRRLGAAERGRDPRRPRVRRGGDHGAGSDLPRDGRLSALG